MKLFVRKNVLLALMFMSLFLLLACTSLNTTSTTQSTSSTSGSDTTLTSSTSTSSTTTSNLTSTTASTTTLSTGAQQESIENLDSLVLSIDRLETVDVNVDFDSIFSETSQEIINLSFPRRYFPGIDTERIISSGNEDITYDPDDYIHHTYWPEPMYHKDLYVEPTLEGGMYQISTLLNSYNNTALNNLYLVADGVFSQANDEVDWAVDHISVMNTWIETVDMGKFLLDYDSVNDVVNLYHVWYLDDVGLTSLNKISVYYNDSGEEVIEKWINEFYSKGDYPGAIGYFNTIGSRDFNFYNVWLNSQSELSDMHMFRGINQTENGNYEYYDNDYSVVSGDFGWYTIIRFLDPSTGNITNYRDMMDTYCPTGDSNVITWTPRWDGYQASVYLPAFSGVEDILVEEGGMIAQNQDSPDTQAFLQSQGIGLMPDQYIYNNDGTEWITGIKTSLGGFLSTDEIWNDSVQMNGVRLRIASEGEKAYSNYYKYLGIMDLFIEADSIEEASQQITAYLAHIGLTYKYGDSSDLFNEYSDFYDNFDEIANNVNTTNAIMKNPYHLYESLEDYAENTNFIYNYVDIRQSMLQMLDDIDSISFQDMPPMYDITSVNLLNVSDMVSGELVLNGNQLDSSQLDVTVPQSPLLRTDKEYSVYYAFSIGNKLFHIGAETTKTYAASALHFSEGLTIELPNDLPDGEYALMLFIAKDNDPGTVRISNAIEAPFASFDPIQLEYDNPETGLRAVMQLVFQDGHAYMNVFHEDIQPPVIMVEGHQAPYSGTVSVSAPVYILGTITVADFLNDMITVIDNFDSSIEVSYLNLTHNSLAILSEMDLMESGLYVLTVQDSTGNITEITFENIIVQFQVVFMYSDGTVILTQFINMGEDATPPEVTVDTGYYLSGWTEDYTNISNHLDVHAMIVANLHTITYMVDDVLYQLVENVEYGSEIVKIADPVNEGYVFSGWSIAPTTMPDEDIIIIGTFTPAP